MFSSPGIWVAEQRGGLCNNLKCLLSTMRLAERDGSALATTCTDIPLVFSGVDQLTPHQLSVDMRRHRDWRLIVFDDDPLDDGFATKRESKGFDDADERGRNIDHEFDRIPQSMRRIYLELIGQLTVRPELLEEIGNHAARWFDDFTVAVHMRTWMTDHWDKAPRRHAHYFRLDYYEALIEQNDNLFICSDNATTLGELQRRFGKRVRCYKPPPEFDPIQVAFVELSLLSKGTRLFGSSLSTFTEMAWWLGGCQAEVTLIDANG